MLALLLAAVGTVTPSVSHVHVASYDQGGGGSFGNWTQDGAGLPSFAYFLDQTSAEGAKVAAAYSAHVRTAIDLRNATDHIFEFGNDRLVVRKATWWWRCGGVVVWWCGGGLDSEQLPVRCWLSSHFNTVIGHNDMLFELTKQYCVHVCPNPCS